MKTLIVTLLCVIQVCVFSQSGEQQKLRHQILSKTDTVAARNLIIEFANRYQVNKMELIEWSKRSGYPIRTVDSDGTVAVLQGIMNGRLIYKKTFNRIAAQTTSTNVVWSEFNLDGTGIEIGHWDGGAVYVDHSSFREGPYGQRHVYFVDPPGTGFNDHATHVAGTIVADNDEYYAKGMANEAVLFSRDWDDDLTEMTNAAYGNDPNLSVPLILSNHSYGNLVGWHWGDLRKIGTNAWYWMAEDYQNEDPWFSNYNQVSFDYDQIAFNFPYYTIVWAAGNDRGEGPEPNAQHWVWNGQNWVSSTNYHPKDGQLTNGFNCLPPDGVAKNLITVGAVDDISYGYQSPADVQQVNTDFSSWGPTKDGRIKPDIVANGDALYSTMPNNLFGSMSGTSMAAPNVTGSLALLLQHYKNTHNNTVPLSSTLKAIVIHTADESGSSLGPDYKYGWGLLNTFRSAQLISTDQGNTATIQELTLQAGTGQSYTLDNLYSEGTQPIKITLAWNDIPPSNYQTGPILMHDLDVRLYKNGTPYYPWKLNPASPNSPAIQSDNTKDNVEQILLQSPGEGYYSVVVSHKGNLAFNQMFSLVVTGFISPFVTFNLKQIGSDGQNFGEAAYWDNLIWNYVPPTQPVTLPIGNNHFLSTQEFRPSTFEKFNKWDDNLTSTGDWYRNWDIITLKSGTNRVSSRFIPSVTNVSIKTNLESTSISYGKIEFFDPWLTDIDEQPYGSRNRGMEAVFKERNSTFHPNYYTSYNGDVYKGVFLNQTPDPQNPDKPYYQVGMLTEQTISINEQNRKFFPYKWTGTGVTFQNESTFESPRTGVVFTSSNAVATAMLKGQLMSSDQNAISSASQRKMVRTDNGQYHVVYESMGTVWYTYSLTSNFYGAWSPDEYLHYHGKNPAIDYDENRITIVFEEYDPQVGGNAKIWLYGYIPVGNGIYEQWNTVDLATYPNSYYGNAKPVVAFNTYYDYGEIFVAYRTNFTEGIKYKTVWIEENLWWSYSVENEIPETNSYCINPAVTGQAGASSSNYVHIAYEQLSSIYYIYAHRGGYYWDFLSSPRNLSSDCGFNYNSYPAISLTTGSVNSYVMVSWQGIYDAQSDNPMPKETGGSEPLRRAAAVVKTGWGPSWGTSSSFSDNVDFTNNGSINMGFGSIMAWSESNGQYSKYVRRRSPLGYDAITPLSDNGIHTLVSNGSGFGDIKAMVFNKSTNAPYFLNRCTDDFTYIPDGMGKLTESGVVDISYGRSGIIEKNGIEFVFNIGDVLLNGETIKFIERADTLPVSSIEELNLSVRTDTLTLTQQSELIFSDYYYVVNGERADSMLSSEFSVHFNCELVKLSTGEVIGLFEQVNYNKTNVEEFGHQGYLVDCSGIEAGDYYLRLTSSVNEEVGLSLSDIQMDNIVLEKSKLNVRNFKGETLPIEYSLDQNYPNPFNPATTIRYQLPKDGMVTLKVYDILGAEVATLVNEEKVAGKYEVSFNASSHASGVYIYRLQANDFISVKKMVLLK